MRKVLIVFTVILTVIVITSCATMQYLPPEQRTHVFDADFNSTLKATVNYCNDKAFPIIVVDKDLGIINTNWKMNDGASKFLLGDIKMKLNFMLNKVNQVDKTKVMATVIAVKSGAFGSQSSVTMTEGRARDYYKIIFDGI